MELLGLSWPVLLGTFAAFASAVVGLYLLKQRRRRASVAYLPLWESLLADQHSSALFSRLKRIGSLLLALLLVALLVFALGEPQLASGGEGRTVVILVDAGETMLVHEQGESRLARAMQKAVQAVAALAPDDRALIAQLDEGVTPLCPLTDDRAQLKSALEQVRPTHLETDFAEAVRFARDVTRGHRDPELLVVSDGLVRGEAEARTLLKDDGAPTLRFIRIGEGPVDNVGVSALAARRYPLDRTHVEVLVRAHNQSEREVRAELTLTAEGRELHRQQVTLPAQDETQLVLTDLPGADRSLTATLRTEDLQDAFTLDDQAVARVPERKRLRVLLVSPGNRYLEAALLLDEYLRVHAAAPGAAPDTNDFDAVIYDGTLPSTAPKAPALYLLPQGPAGSGYSPLALRDAFEERPFVGRVEPDHPLTRFAALTDINMRAARLVRLEKGDRAVVRTEQGHPLLVSGQRDGSPFVALTFDPRESDLPMRVAWPLLVLNALDVLTGQRPGFVDNHRVGEIVHASSPAEAGRVTLEAPDGQRRVLRADRGEVQFVPELSGLYRLQGEGFADAVAVQRRDKPASSLAPRETLADVEPTKLQEATARSRRRLWPWLLLVALAIATLEWLSFHRRVTV